jgi:hypothetical protein
MAGALAAPGDGVHVSLLFQGERWCPRSGVEGPSRWSVFFAFCCDARAQAKYEKYIFFNIFLLTPAATAVKRIPSA